MNVEIKVPNGESGNVKIDEFTVKENELSQVISMMKTGRGVPAGHYKRLLINGEVVMSNTPDEISDFYFYFLKFDGDILINGLGFGVTVQYLLDNNPNVKSITVIEKNEDVIKLVAPTYKVDKRVNIIHADCFDWKPPKGIKYDYVWHDIWNNICSDNLEEMKKLHRKYGRVAKHQKSWCREECERLKREENRFFGRY